MTARRGELDSRYFIPSRTIGGSPEEMLAQIDEAVRGLLALRHLVNVQQAQRAVAEASPARAGLRLVPPGLHSASVNR